MSDRKGALAVAPIRINSPLEDAAELADWLLYDGPDQQRVLDQLWLATVLREQRRRVRIQERDAFDARADRILAALDPPEAE
jgi:hypothetical protein